MRVRVPNLNLNAPANKYYQKHEKRRRKNNDEEGNSNYHEKGKFVIYEIMIPFHANG